jgi:hypothetical protein
MCVCHRVESCAKVVFNHFGVINELRVHSSPLSFYSLSYNLDAVSNFEIKMQPHRKAVLCDVGRGCVLEVF